jgi:hypothetical protein
LARFFPFQAMLLREHVVISVVNMKKGRQTHSAATNENAVFENAVLVEICSHFFQVAFLLVFLNRLC